MLSRMFLLMVLLLMVTLRLILVFGLIWILIAKFPMFFLILPSLRCKTLPMSTVKLLWFIVVASVSKFVLMKQFDLHYDPVRDVSPVQPYGFIDLRKALETKRIPADASAVPAAFNGIEDPAAVLGRPADAFDSLALQETIRNYKPSNHPADAE